MFFNEAIWNSELTNSIFEFNDRNFQSHKYSAGESLSTFTHYPECL